MTTRGPSKRTIIPKGVPFSMIPHAVTEDLDVTNAGFRVYVEMAKLANTESRAWPGHRYLERVLPMARKTVHTALRNLEETGWLIIDRTKQNHTYTVVFEQLRLDLNRGDNDTGVVLTPVEFLPSTGVITALEPGEFLPHTENQTETHTENQVARKRSPKPEWDFLTDPAAFNMPTGTKAQEKRVGMLTREIRASLDHERISGYDDRTREMHARAAAWPLHFEGATLTPEAFAKHLTQLGQPPLRRSKGQTTRAATMAALQALEDDHESA